ncbi:prepilin-type N-terminal cleavage/methylation domain-containing protein [Ruminococcus flavefaciens]|uniref:Prepilin-type N-terminal cleavage/methylation domain-containing protein n=1 Tax=Ruminococcus flavefaciens TaxID=1265 RepID=A0A1M7KYE1_RUMFL|nr:type II secretion system protein [Ruminococcus flavefaciens]SHM70563.1 prepilin-type N-terminal cleavage/methylation domain-containing protein [Ruminococcus flavefaciens]
MKAKKTRKGFTLMELIIVIAIMGIMMAIIIPSWGYFIRRARERDANSRAKVVFNAAQTEVTRVCNSERSTLNKINDPNTDSTLRDKLKKQIYMGSGEFYFYWDGKKGVKVSASGTAVDETTNNLNNGAFARAVNNITGGEGFYKIYVKDYNVQSVVYTAYENGNYKGTYPKSMNELDNKTLGDVRTTSIKSINDAIMKKLVVTK